MFLFHKVGAATRATSFRVLRPHSTVPSQLDLLRTFGIDPTVMANFLNKIEEGYKSTNAYHNALHAADVVCLLVSCSTLVFS
jgi:hypothetical protein